MKTLTMEVNGKTVTLEVEPDAMLVDVLREKLGLTGTKRGCNSGECGACTVLVDGEPVASCMYPALKAQGKKILTIEGLGSEGNLHPLQDMFLEKGAVQCGFCTPGVILAAKALLDKNPNPSEQEIRVAISGNLCRCTGYAKIVEAVKAAAALLRGEQPEPAPAQEEKPGELGAIGRNTRRVDGVPKVLGKAKFAADLVFPNMLYAKVLRSPYPHARILSINTAKAAALPGVAAVLTAKDIPGRNRYGIIIKDQPVLAEDKVRFAGEAVAIVAAENERLAEEALSLIEVEYEELPVVTSALEAMREDAPKVHEAGNVLHHRKIRKGNVEEGFAQAAVIVEDTFKTQLVEHAYIEPEAGVAVPEPDGRLTIYAVSQGVHYVRNEIAAILGWPVNRVRVVQTVTGGGFGGKIDLSVHPYIALLAVKTGRPVKLVYTREESMLASTKRHPFIMTYKIGATKEGKLIAAEVKIIGDTGAYASYGPAVLTRSAYCSLGPYDIPNVKVDAYTVYTNNPIAGAMRGFGAPQMAIAHESIIDTLAEKLGLSPVEIRLKNAFTEGSETPAGQVLVAGVGIKETIIQAAARAGLK